MYGIILGNILPKNWSSSWDGETLSGDLNFGSATGASISRLKLGTSTIHEERIQLRGSIFDKYKNQCASKKLEKQKIVILDVDLDSEINVDNEICDLKNFVENF